MIHYTDIFRHDDLIEMIRTGYVRVAEDPIDGFRLLSYTPKAQVDRMWNAVTRACRGLIVNQQGFVVARPFAKFHGVGEPEAPVFQDGTLVSVSDKADGSMATVFWRSDGQPAIATRGSFTSPQSVVGTEILREKIAASAEFGEMIYHGKGTRTEIFEVLYPENRIVVDYGDTRDLIHLGSIDIATGRTVTSPASTEPTLSTYIDVLRREPRSNAEGYVIRNVATDERLKIKHEEYKALHRIITQCTARTLWEHLAVNSVVDLYSPTDLANQLKMSPTRTAEILAAGPGWKDVLLRPGLPQRFSTWVDVRSRAMSELVERRVEAITTEFESAKSFPWPEGLAPSRKDYAMRWAKHPDKAALFSMLDNRSPLSYCWLAEYPDHELPFADVG